MSGPRLGFLGCGPLARRRIEAMLAGEEVEAAAFCDPDLDQVAHAIRLSPDAVIVPNIREMLELALDGIVIGSPAEYHSAHATQALKGGTAVFCHKPLGRTAAETAAPVEAARAADTLLGIDLPYRHTDGMQRIREYVAGGEIGSVFAADLTFHAARGRTGPEGEQGGCAASLGATLVDLALWTLGFPAVEKVESNLYAMGEPLEPGEAGPEDFALATLTLATGAAVRIACSWDLRTGQEAVIDLAFHGTDGGAAMKNVAGSLVDFRADIHRGPGRSEMLSAPGDPWQGRAAARWAARLASGEAFDREVEKQLAVAEVVDRIYRR